MKNVNKKLLPLLALAGVSAVWAVDKDKGKFIPPSIDQVSTKQSSEGVTIAVVPYQSDSQAQTAFGKVNPYDHGVLPVLLMIRNDSKETIRLESLKADYIDRDRERIEATPAAEVKFGTAPRRPNMNPSPIPGIRRNKKNPLAAEEIEMRGWTARMLPPGESAHGFLYFRTGHRSGARVYVTGLQMASSGRELFYFDIPLD